MFRGNVYVLLIFSSGSPLTSATSSSSSFTSPLTMFHSTTSTFDKTSITLSGQSTKRKTKNLFSYSTSKETYKKNNIISEHLMNLTLHLLFQLKTSSDTVSITHECTKYHTSSHLHFNVFWHPNMLIYHYLTICIYTQMKSILTF